MSLDDDISLILMWNFLVRNVSLKPISSNENKRSDAQLTGTLPHPVRIKVVALIHLIFIAELVTCFSIQEDAFRSDFRDLNVMLVQLFFLVLQ